MPKSTVYAVRPDRLGGRLSAIINAKRMADMFDLDLKVFWSKPKSAYPELSHPEAVFSQEFIDKHFLPEDTLKGQLKFTPMIKPAAPRRNLQTQSTAGKKTNFKPVLPSGPRQKRSDFIARIQAGEDFGFTTREGAIPLPFEKLSDAQVGFAEAFLALDFSDEFRKTMAHIDDVVADGETYVGVHIRRGDVIRNQNTSEGFWHGQYTPDVAYFTALDALSEPKVQIVLFCDDAVVLQSFQQRYPNAYAAEDICATTDQPALHVDMAEMYLLSRCTRVICPRSSAFSMTAADLSAMRREPVESLLNTEQMKAVVDGLVAQLSEGVSAFHSIGDLKQSLNALASYRERGFADISAISIARIAKQQNIATVTVLEHAITEALNSDDLGCLSWLSEMVTQYPVPHISALGDCFALLAYGADAVGDKSLAQQYLTWGYWFYPESQVCGAIASVLAGPMGQFSNQPYSNASAKLPFPVHRGLQFITRGKHADQFDGLWRHLNYTSGFLMMDWPEFMNPKTRRRMLMRSALPRKLEANLFESFAALDLVLSKRSKEGLASLKILHQAQPTDPYVAKRLATALFRMGQNSEALDMMKASCDLAPDNPAFKAAYAIRLSEFLRMEDAVVEFDELTSLGVEWINAHPAVNASFAHACMVTKAYQKGFDLISKNIATVPSCKVSLTLHKQLKKYI